MTTHETTKQSSITNNIKAGGSAQFTQAAAAITTPVRIIRLPEVITRVGLKRASIYQHIAAGSFPTQIALGVRAVGWLENEIDEWLALRVQERHLPRA